MNYVMCFEVVDAFIIPVAASTVFSSLDTFIHDPVAAATKIVAEIPTVSTFFMAYVLMRALTNSAMDIARVIHRMNYSLVKAISGRTPRVYSRLNCAMYSPMAPLMAITAAAYYALFSFVYAYKFMNVYDDNSFRLGGRIAVKLLQQRWISLYVSQAVFCGAFAIRTSTRSTTQAKIQLVLSCATLAGTFVVHMLAKRRLYPLLLHPVLPPMEVPAVVQESQAEPAELRLCIDQIQDNPSIQEMSHGTLPRQSYMDSSADSCAERTRPAEKIGMAQLLGTATPLAYEPWRVDLRPETAQVGPGARLLRDVATNTPLLWQAEMTDPGYVFIWLPDIQTEEDGDLSAAVAPANLNRSMLSNGYLEHRPSCKKTVDVAEEDMCEPSFMGVQTLADMLYAEINHRLGSYGSVVTMHAVLEKRGIRATTLTRPEKPVHPMMRRA
ncbi:phosphate metabolism protein 7 [Coemansia sp. BCRC 34301]|nr:phosphate metabolism protein 7 [Coemansia sp. BCRC 34301]